MHFGLPRLTPMVKRLLIINVAVFFAALVAPRIGFYIYEWGQIDATYWPRGLQLWRLVTYQFLHDPGGIFHILFNMVGLFFLGCTLERHWGSKKFLLFYLGCGVCGGLFYLLLAALKVLPAGVMVGASGAVLGLLAACAILFPQFVVFFLFFPVPIRFAAVILTFVYILNIFRAGPNAGGDAAHLAGMAAGAAYVFSHSWRAKVAWKWRSAMAKRRSIARQDLRAELDRILEKIHNSGIHSLTSREKKILKRATEQQQLRNRF
jgi:membrane associated rhomboid family serine protease